MIDGLLGNEKSFLGVKEKAACVKFEAAFLVPPVEPLFI